MINWLQYQSMYCLYHRIGIVYRETISQNRKSYSIHYFFLDDDNKLFYMANLARLQRVLRTCSNASEISTILNKNNEKSLSLSRFNIGEVKVFPGDITLPFTNRNYIQVKEKDGPKELRLMPLVQEDLKELLALLKQPQKNLLEKSRDIHEKSYAETQKRKETQILNALFQKCLDLADKMVLPKQKLQSLGDLTTQNHQKQIVEFNDNLHYLGQLKNGKPQGQGKVVLVNEGISYNGEFHNGLKHGSGYLVNSNLDTLYCQFVEDELCGI